MVYKNWPHFIKKVKCQVPIWPVNYINTIKGQHLQIASVPSSLVFDDKFMILTLIIKLHNSRTFNGSWLHACLYFLFLLVVLENSMLFPFILKPTDLL